MKRHIFWTLNVAMVLFMILSLSYIYNTTMDASTFMDIMKKYKPFSKKEQMLTEKPLIVEKTNHLSGVWTINAIGRLGNLMGQYATLYSLAKMNGRQAYISPAMHEELSKVFKISLQVLPQEVASGIKWINYRLNDWMCENYSHIEREYIYLGGYPNSFTFYHHIKDEILREFTFHDFLVEASYAYLNKISSDKKNVTFVGVHVRRGDYVQVMPNIWKGVVADKRYLQNAMDYFRNKYENPLFIVTSNGMDWCENNIDNSLGDVYFAGDGQNDSPALDFALLVHCNHTIMTIGTFGVWAGYMAGGETIYLTNYTLPDSPFLKVFKYEATFLPEWIGLPADLSPLLVTQKP
ncbi:galactoside alpha-(1,2)-fucosyltransferase 2-like [Rana temporaria]|uniref:galactoside alpha-(1,2)-fucosyltransferase 2-like n=1 Tax=Rana temporaria TaxID=8407 RepID=UPI001AAD14C0|nr:galactoside alpha-(1,2)-fucosyltransferase 2-like [Rana temporaria]